MVAPVGDTLIEPLQNIEDLEIDLLLEGVYRLFGQDFRGYRRESVRQRLHALMRGAGLNTVSALQERVMHDHAAGDALLRALSIQPAALFDDPMYFQTLRKAMVPWLRSCPSPKVWVAECVAPEEVCELAILLAEEGLYERTQIFATAANESLLEEARAGEFALDRWPEYAENYRKCGGKADLARYCREDHGKGVFSRELRANVTWAQYSLATDASFNEFQLIVCRNALSDFGVALHRRTLQLFYDSMPLFGILSVDSKEGLNAAPFVSRYKAIAEGQGLYRRVV
jgi:chemotaxis protein methyltransferase CheR